MRIGAAVHSVRAVPAEQLRDRRARPPAGRPLHVHLSEQPAENDACARVLRPHPDAPAAPTGACSARDTTAVHATHLTDDDIAAARRHRHGGLRLPHAPRPTWPTASARSAGCGTPARRCASAATSTPSTDLLAEARAARGATSGWSRGERGRFRPAELRRRPHRRRPPRAGLAGRRAHRPRAAGRPGRRPAGHAPHGRMRPRSAGHGRRRRRRAHRGRRRPGRGRPTGSTCSATSAGSWPTRSNPCGRTHEHRSSRASASSSPTTRRWATVRWASSRTPRSSSRTGPSSGSGPRRTRPTPTTGVDVGGRAVIPGFVDSHAHLVFAGDRAAEFEARMSGAPLRRRRDRHHRRRHPGGVRRRAARPAAARCSPRCGAQGTTTVEVKSGYGLTVEDEARCLRLAAEVTPETTFLGAHVVPAEYAGRADEYVALVTGPMLAACAPHARWVDVFCEPASAHAFDGDQARAVLEAGRAAGLGLRVHANQLSAGPGRAARRRARRRQRRPLHPPERRRRRRAGRRDDGRDPAAGRGVLHPVALSGRPPAARRRGDGRAGHRLQPGQLLHLVDGVLHRAGRPRDADDAGRGAVGGDRRRRGRAAPRPTSATSAPGARADLAVLDAPSYRHLAYRPGVPLVRALELPG